MNYDESSSAKGAGPGLPALLKAIPAQFAAQGK
jgi:hypothetical protein